VLLVVLSGSEIGEVTFTSPKSAEQEARA